MSGDPLDMTEDEAQIRAEQDAADHDDQRRRLLLQHRAQTMPLDEIVRLIERCEGAERDRDNYRAALRRIAISSGLTGHLYRSIARDAIEAPF